MRGNSYRWFVFFFLLNPNAEQQSDEGSGDIDRLTILICVGAGVAILVILVVAILCRKRGDFRWCYMESNNLIVF